MEKNYYKILEIDKDASPEIIKKAYTTLAKKYHPDLQENPGKKQEYENILKQINEAYEVLSNEEKRKEYDFTLSQNEVNTYTQNSLYNNTTNSYSNNINDLRSEYNEELRKKQETEYEKQIQYARQKAYYDAYIQDLKNRGYTIKYKKSFKDYIKIFVSVLATFIIIILIYQIPPVKTYFKNLYNTNYAFKFIIDFFSSIINIFFKIFKGDI